MLKKVGKIIIIFIVAFCIGIGIVLGLFIEAIVSIELGDPYGWEVNQRLSNNTITWLEGNINVSYPSNNPFADIIPNHLKGFLKFKKEDIGVITFKNPRKNSQLDDIEGINIGCNKTYKIYLGIFNYQLPIIWNNYFDNSENGTITMDMVFYFRIKNINITFRVPHPRYSVNIPPITDRINQKIFNDSITGIMNITFWRKLQISKDNYSKIITFVPDFLLKFRRYLWKSTMKLTDDFYLLENQDNFTIFCQNFTLYSMNRINWFLKLFFLKPHCFKIYGNNIEIGEITLELDENLPLDGGLIHKIFWKKSAFFLNVTIYDMMLDDCFRSIVKNKENLTLKIFYVHKGIMDLSKLIFKYETGIDLAGFFNNLTKSKRPETYEKSISYLPELNKNMQLIIILLAYGLSAWVIGDAIWEEFFKKLN